MEDFGRHHRHENLEERTNDGCSCKIVINLFYNESKNRTKDVSIGIRAGESCDRTILPCC